jgi:hypothetical protein
MDVTLIRQRVRRLLADRVLPCDQERAWAGPGGQGTHCVACDEPIAPTEIEFEVELVSPGPVLRLHRVCYAIWREECEPPGHPRTETVSVR